jgi:hypothetical protein
MTLQTLDQITTVSEQRFLLPGHYTWKEFEIIEALTAEAAGLCNFFGLIYHSKYRRTIVFNR